MAAEALPGRSFFVDVVAAAADRVLEVIERRVSSFHRFEEGDSGSPQIDSFGVGTSIMHLRSLAVARPSVGKQQLRKVFLYE